jgi:hypothetical protein
MGITIAVIFPAFAAFGPPVEQQILPDDRPAGDEFGISVWVDSSIVQGYLVADPFRNDEAAFDAGKAYAFVRDSPGEWSQQGQLADPDGEVGDFLGVSVSIDGETIAVGAFGDGSGSGGTYAGSVYLFDLDDNLLNESLKITPPSPYRFDNFGFSVAASEDDIAVGAFGEGIDSMDGDNAGAAYVYSLPEPAAITSCLAAVTTVALLRKRRLQVDRT